MVAAPGRLPCCLLLAVLPGRLAYNAALDRSTETTTVVSVIDLRLIIISNTR